MICVLCGWVFCVGVLRHHHVGIYGVVLGLLMLRGDEVLASPYVFCWVLGVGVVDVAGRCSLLSIYVQRVPGPQLGLERNQLPGQRHRLRGRGQNVVPSVCVWARALSSSKAARQI